MNRFRDRTLRKEYDAAMFAFDTKHRNLFYPNGSRCMGSSFAGFFWRGFDGMTGGICNWTEQYARTTLAYAYWRAGQDARRKVIADDIARSKRLVDVRTAPCAVRGYLSPMLIGEEYRAEDCARARLRSIWMRAAMIATLAQGIEP